MRLSSDREAGQNNGEDDEEQQEGFVTGRG